MTALRQMELEQRITTAAGVSARMRQADASFTPTSSGFPNFRALLQRAQDEGRIRVQAPAGGSDVLISSVDVGTTPDRPKAGIPTGPGVGTLGGWLRPDLWRALNDWSDTQYVYDRRSRRTLPVGHPAVEEDHALPLPTLSPEERLAWMRTFAEELAPPSVRDLLLRCLEQDTPGSSFHSAIGAQQQTQRRWRGFLRTRLMDRMQTWAAEHGLDFSELLNSGQAGEHQSQASAQTDRHEPGTWAARQARSGSSLGNPEEDLRREVLDLLAKLPLTELLKLPIPLEYTLRR